MSDQTDPFSEPFLSFWKGYFEKSDQVTRQLLGSKDDIGGSQALNRQRLDAISKVMEVYLRSPEFLGALRQNINNVIAAKQQLNDLIRQRGGGDPATSDVREGGKPFDTASHMALAGVMQQAPAMMWNRFADACLDAIAPARDSVNVTPYDVVYQAGSLRLWRFLNDSPAHFKEPVLICFSLVNRPYVLDLQRNRSVIRQLLQQGLDVYLVDWGVPTEDDHTLRLYDYICVRMKDVVDFICEHSRSPQVSLLGYCMGGTMSAIFASLYRQVRNLVLLAAPIDFSGDESLLNVWTRAEYFDVDGLIDAFGNCPGSLLQMCFQQTKPVQNYVEKYMNLGQKMGDDAFLENFFSIERWANDNIPVAGETFREFVKLLYQRNLLVQGKMRLNLIPVDLSMITCPLLMLTADFDHLVPPSSTLAMKHHVSSTEVAEMSINAGHIGLAVSSKAHRQLWPQAAAWIAAHSTSSPGVRKGTHEKT